MYLADQYPWVENIRLIAEIIGYTAGLATAIFILFQLSKDRKLSSLNALMRLEEKYSKLLWRINSDEELGSFWQGRAAGNRLDAYKGALAVADHEFPLWEAMGQNTERGRQDRNCYAATREMLDIFEQAFHFNRSQGWLCNREIKAKWTSWMKSAKANNPFVMPVFAELEGWYTPSFVRHFRGLKAQPRDAAAAPASEAATQEA